MKAKSLRPLSRAAAPLAIPAERDGISLKARAYELVKRRIITLGYPPGGYLNEASVAADLKIGRTPVRYALERLALEGLVDILPRKGVIVRPLSLDEIMAVIEVRLINEAYGARLAAQRSAPADVRKMEAILELARTRTRRRDVEGLMVLDRQFHAAIAQAARNRVLAQLLERLHERSLRFWFLSLSRPKAGHLEDIAAQHGAVLDAIEAGDPDRAEAAIRGHIEAFRRTIGETL